METYLHLEFPDFNKKYFNYLKFNSKTIKIDKNFADIKINKELDKERYLEKVKLFNNENDFVEHNIEIYFNQINNYDCIISSKNDYSFSIYQYNKKNLLDKIDVQLGNDIYNITKYDNNGLKYCRRFNIINCPLDSLKRNNFDIPNFLSKGSYNINLFHNKKSIQRLKEPIYNEIDFSKISKDDKDYLLSFEPKVNKEYNKLYNDNKSNVEEKNIKFKQTLDKMLSFKAKYKFDTFEKIKSILATRKKRKFYENQFEIIYGYAYFLVLISLKKSDIAFTLYGIFINILNDLKINIPNDFDIIRIIIWFNDNYLLNNKFEERIYNFSSLETLDVADNNQIKNLLEFSFIYPKKIKNNTPYKICYEFLNEFIENLTEDSSLFEIIYLLDSDTGSNRLYKNVRQFQLSLYNLNQIKQHLKSTIPDVIIRKFHSENDVCNGSFYPSYGVIQCYEGILYDINDISTISKIIENEDKECIYTMPLIMLFFHELFGHSKHRLDNNYSMSPTHFYNPYDDYKLCYHYHLGESGRLFEYYISNDVEIIKYLKFGLYPNKILLSSKLWVANDLSKLREIIKEKILKNKFTCKKNLSNFPDGKGGDFAILATGKEDEKYLTDQSKDIIYNYDDNSDNYYPNKIFLFKGSIDCI